MASTITAGNATNGLALSCDNTGILELKTGTGSGTTAMTIGTGQQVAVTLGSAAAPSITFSGDTNTGIFSPAADTLGFAEGGTEVGRFDSSGNLLVGTTTADGRVTVHASTSDALSSALTAKTSGSNLLLRVRADGLYNLGLQTNSPYNFTSTGANAILFNDGTFGRATSSLKYKRNVETSTNGLQDVLKLRAVTYKSKNERDGETIFGGLIAEEVHAAGLTEFVQYAEDGTPDSLYYANMVSLAFKAIQEQQQMIETLQAKVAALEGA